MPPDSEPRRRLGLVLGGGGVRGLAHAGALATLSRAGIEPDVLVGVSMGGVVAAVCAARADWETALESVDRTRLPAFADPREDEGLKLVRTALRSARRLAPSVWTWGRSGYEEFGRSTLSEVLGSVTDFSQTRIPLAVVATDILRGERCVLTHGDLVSATLASAAIPGVAKPVTRDGRTLIDGGFVDPAPVDVARALGADIVVAVYTGQHLEPADADNWLLALLRGLEIGQRAFADERLATADLVLRPDFGERINVFDFSAIDAVVRSGARCALDSIESILDLMGADAATSARALERLGR
jgi:NTE family protein